MREQDKKFFQPVWRRVTIVLVCASWAMFEWIIGERFWGIVATGITGYAYWAYFQTFDTSSPEDS